MIRELTKAEIDTVSTAPFKKLGRDFQAAREFQAYVAEVNKAYDQTLSDTFHIVQTFLTSDAAFLHVVLYYGYKRKVLVVVTGNEENLPVGHFFKELDEDDAYGLGAKCPLDTPNGPIVAGEGNELPE